MLFLFWNVMLLCWSVFEDKDTTACSEQISFTWVPRECQLLHDLKRGSSIVHKRAFKRIHLYAFQPKNVLRPLICDFYFSTYILIFIAVKSIFNVEKKRNCIWKGKWLYFQYLCSLYHIPPVTRLHWLKYALVPFFWTCVYKVVMSFWLYVVTNYTKTIPPLIVSLKRHCVTTPVCTPHNVLTSCNVNINQTRKQKPNIFYASSSLFIIKSMFSR